MLLMSSIKLLNEEKQICLRIARESISHGLSHGSALQVDLDGYENDLIQHLACFVTLHKKDNLRGCIGALEAYQPLIKDIAEHAFAAAFNDPRFPALESNELDLLQIEISVLGPSEKMIFTDEKDLLQQIRPNIDGLILEFGSHRGTFLPSVWQQLPDKKEFLNHLKVKANLSANWWDNSVSISRYETLSF